jgi:hypothetical protein
MSSLLVRLPDWLCEFAYVRVRMRDRVGSPNTPLEVPAGAAIVSVDISVAREGPSADGSLEVPVEIPPGGIATITPPL